MQNVDKLSDQQFRRELNDHLDAEADAQRMAELHDDEVKFLTSPGQEFYPFTHDHIQEALGNMPENHQMVISAYIGAADDLPDNEICQSFATNVIRKFIREYWETVASEVC
ncbi:MAG TPA: hypothetical protein VJ987_07265 [Anaerolineales bacterium]|nr:hypothetical protein [Anaerolineales bacterium]